jgi:hypothetical protein
MDPREYAEIRKYTQEKLAKEQAEQAEKAVAVEAENA